MSQPQLNDALDLLKTDDFRPGENWEKAHEICQQNAGVCLFDWAHALVHRIEGDDANAQYWYRLVGQDRHPGSIEEEWQAIRTLAEET